MKIKVFFLIPFLGGGGAERVVLRLLRFLDRERFAPFLVLKERSGSFSDQVPPGVVVLDCGGYGFGGKWRWFPNYARHLRKEKPDVVLSFLWYANVVSVLARSATRVRCRVVLSERSTILESREGFVTNVVRRMAIRSLYPRADRVVANSRGLARQLVEHFGIPERMVVAIPNPLDVEEIESRSEVKGFRGSGECPIVAGMGRFTREKGFDLLLRAFALVDKPSRLLLIGEGKEGGRLRELSRKLGIGDRVEFAGFQVDPFPLLSRVDVFVLPSRHEGFPNALIEAMALGVPCVATRCPTGPEEILTDGEDGFLVPVEDPEEIAVAVRRLLSTPALRERIGEAGRRRVRAYDAARITRRYEALLEEGTA